MVNKTGFNHLLKWLRKGRELNAKYLIITTSDFSKKIVPFYIQHELRDWILIRSFKNKILEVYNLEKDWDLQLKEERSLNYKNGDE